MGGKLSLVTAVLGALMFAVAFGCDDSKDYANAGNYSACEGEILNNQKVICDDLKAGVEGLCGFDLTVEPCTCVAAITGCTTDTDWLQSILDCRSASATCVAYMTCLEGVGTSPSGCTDPTTWECIVPSTDAGGQ